MEHWKTETEELVACSESVMLLGLCCRERRTYY